MTGTLRTTPVDTAVKVAAATGPPVDRALPNRSRDETEKMKGPPAINDGVRTLIILIGPLTLIILKGPLTLIILIGPLTLTILIGPEARPGRTEEEKGLPDK
jgi:hypothetical protein